MVAVLPAQLKLSISEIALDIKVADPAHSSAVMTVPVTSSWALDSSSNNVELVGYFDSPSAALTDNLGDAIPSSHVLGSLGGQAMAAFDESSRVGVANASRSLFRERISRQNVSASRTDMLSIQLTPIDDLGAPAAEYRGTLNLRLIAY